MECELKKPDKLKRPNAADKTASAETTALETLATLRLVAQQHVAELEQELALAQQTDPLTPRSSSERERSVRSLRTLLKIIEEISELEIRFKNADSKNNRNELDDKQRQDLARRIKALRHRN